MGFRLACGTFYAILSSLIFRATTNCSPLDWKFVLMQDAIPIMCLLVACWLLRGSWRRSLHWLGVSLSQSCTTQLEESLNE
jgi:hypothetical protein